VKCSPYTPVSLDYHDLTFIFHCGVLLKLRPDVHPGNLLLGIKDDSPFRKLEENEMSSPVPRKQLDDRTLYLSRLMKPKIVPLLLSDFGETRVGPGPHAGDIMPIMYRAPETLLYTMELSGGYMECGTDGKCFNQPIM
jgi:hypothetical protein